MSSDRSTGSRARGATPYRGHVPAYRERTSACRRRRARKPNHDTPIKPSVQRTHERREALWVHDAFDVAVDEAACGRRRFATALGKPLLEVGQWALPSDDDDADAPRDEGDVQPDRPRPAPRDEPAEHDVQEERAVHDGDDVGKEPVHHDSQSLREFRAYGHRMNVRRAATLAVLIAYAWCATALRPFTAAATVAVVGAGAAAMTWSAMHRPVQPRRGVRRPGIVGWIVLFGILARLQGVAYWQHPRSEHPTLSSMTNDVLETHAAEALACTAWLVIAIRLATRLYAPSRLRASSSSRSRWSATRSVLAAVMAPRLPTFSACSCVHGWDTSWCSCCGSGSVGTSSSEATTDG